MLVHNNWIKGHAAKRARFREWGMWDANRITYHCICVRACKREPSVSVHALGLRTSTRRGGS